MSDLKVTPPVPKAGQSGRSIFNVRSIGQIINALTRQIKGVADSSGQGIGVRNYGNRVMLQPTENFPANKTILQTFSILEEFPDYLKCALFNFGLTPQIFDSGLGANAVPIYVAKPYDLQSTPWPTPPTITPPYEVGDIICARFGPTGYSSTYTYTDGNNVQQTVTQPILWMDENNAGRHNAASIPSTFTFNLADTESPVAELFSIGDNDTITFNTPDFRVSELNGGHPNPTNYGVKRFASGCSFNLGAGTFNQLGFAPFWNGVIAPVYNTDGYIATTLNGPSGVTISVPFAGMYLGWISLEFRGFVGATSGTINLFSNPPDQLVTVVTQFPGGFIAFQATCVWFASAPGQTLQAAFGGGAGGGAPTMGGPYSFFGCSYLGR